MQAVWNHLDLNRPPTCSWKASSGEFDSSRFLSSIDKIIKEFSCQDILHTEAAILSRLIYRMKSKFRGDKGFKNMEKVNRALRNYLKLSLEKEYECLKQSIEIDKEITILPTRQMLQYALIRTQGFGKLMCRVESVAQIAGKFLKNRIHIGQAWTVTVIAYSVVSRIWLLARHLVKKCCTWYCMMYPYVAKLKLVGAPWMPDKQSLPADLKIWLAVPWIDREIEWPPNEQLSDSIFSLIKTQDDEKFEENIPVEGDEETKPETVKNNDINFIPNIGEKISRESFQLELKSSKKQKESKKSTVKIDKIKTKEDLLRLLTLDAYPGLDKLQWNILKKIIKKISIKLEKYPTDSVKYKLFINKVRRSIRNFVS